MFSTQDARDSSNNRYYQSQRFYEKNFEVDRGGELFLTPEEIGHRVRDTSTMVVTYFDAEGYARSEAIQL